jgi:hypothetical protein
MSRFWGDEHPALRVTRSRLHGAAILAGIYGPLAYYLFEGGIG